jgi:hypothetical protein
MIISAMTGMNAHSDHERQQALWYYENRKKNDIVMAPIDITFTRNFVKICNIIRKINGGRSDCMAISYVSYVL